MILFEQDGTKQFIVKTTANVDPLYYQCHTQTLPAKKLYRSSMVTNIVAFVNCIHI